jgi:hypothetical protein
MSQKVKIIKDPRRFSIVLAKESRCASDHLSLFLAYSRKTTENESWNKRIFIREPF